MNLGSKRKSIGLFVPYLGGFYLGSIIEEFRKQCYQKNYNLITIMTSSKPMEYELPLAINQIDAAYITVDTLSKKLVETLRDGCIPVVSASDEYFPLDVDVVNCDQVKAAEEAFKHLYEQGHRRIGFVGMLSLSDFRIRHESYLNCCRKYNLEHSSEWTIDVFDSGIAGGTQSAEIIASRTLDCTAYICGSDLLAIGLINSQKNRGINIPSQVAIVAIDNTRLGQLHSPSITSVDQGINEMVSEAIQQFESRWAAPQQKTQKKVVMPKLISRQSSCSNLEHSDIPISDGIAHYMQDHNELGMALGGLNYRWLADLSDMWGPFFDWMCVAKWERRTKSESDKKDMKLRVHDVITSSLEHDDVPKTDIYYEPENFPTMYTMESREPRLITLIPISSSEHNHCVVAVFDTLRDSMDHAAYNMFNYYAVLMTIFQEKEAITEQKENSEKSARELAKYLEVITNSSSDGIWIWDLETNRVEWNSRSLEMLGYHCKIDQENYKSMSFFERIHPSDVEKVRLELKKSLQKNCIFQQSFRMKKKGGSYIWVKISGDIIRSHSGDKKHLVGSINDITENVNYQNQIKYLAYHDVLTSIPNRRAITELINKKISLEYNNRFAICLIDLNRFKIVNDTFGHQCGDALIQHTAKCIQSILSPHDAIARFGGDEFILLLENLSFDDVPKISNSIKIALEQPLLWNGKEILASASMGYAFYPKHGDSTNELIKRSDFAMYKAKKDSQNFAVYNDKLELISYSYMIESQLKQALLKDEFNIAIQPLINTSSNVLKGGEVLIRWTSSELGNVPPSKFIPIAEQSALIGQIGDWVLEQTILLLKKWQRKGIEDINLSVNISNVQLLMPGFAERFCQKIYKANLPANLLTVEITESCEMADLSIATDVIAYIQKFGCLISLDDFGTGYSSLSMLYNLPIDLVKLDRSFISNFHDDVKRTAMLNSLISMCHGLGYLVVAEGIECKEEAELLNHLGCDIFQGYYFSKPLSIQEFESKYLGLEFV